MTTGDSRSARLPGPKAGTCASRTATLYEDEPTIHVGLGPLKLAAFRDHRRIGEQAPDLLAELPVCLLVLASDLLLT